MAEFAFAKTSGTVTRDRETNWPIADRSFPSNDIRKNCGAHFGSTFLTVSWQIQVDITYAKCGANRVYYGGFENTKQRKGGKPVPMVTLSSSQDTQTKDKTRVSMISVGRKSG